MHMLKKVDNKFMNTACMIIVNLQDIDEDSDASRDEHDISVHLKVLVDDPLDGLIEQHSRQHPDDQHRHQGTNHLYMIDRAERDIT